MLYIFKDKATRRIIYMALVLCLICVAVVNLPTIKSWFESEVQDMIQSEEVFTEAERDLDEAVNNVRDAADPDCFAKNPGNYSVCRIEQ